MYPDVRVDVKDPNSGAVVASFTMGAGIRIFPGDVTSLILYKAANEKNLPPGVYDWDLKVPFSTTVAEYPMRGQYYSIKYVTQ